MIDTRQFTPVTPMALSPTAPIVPDTCVPWPSSSAGSASSLAKSQPWTSSTKPLPSLSRPSPGISRGFVQALAARSGWVTSRPLSITATTTPRDPVVTSHAAGASMSASATPPRRPVLCRPQSAVNEASLGIARGVRARSGSIDTTADVCPAQASMLATGTPGAIRSSTPVPSDVVRQPRPPPRSAAARGAAVRRIQAPARTSTVSPCQSIRRVSAAATARQRRGSSRSPSMHGRARRRAWFRDERRGMAVRKRSESRESPPVAILPSASILPSSSRDGDRHGVSRRR